MAGCRRPSSPLPPPDPTVLQVAHTQPPGALADCSRWRRAGAAMIEVVLNDRLGKKVSAAPRAQLQLAADSLHMCLPGAAECWQGRLHAY